MRGQTNCLCGRTSVTPLFTSGLYDVIKCTYCLQVRIEAQRGAKRTGYYGREDVQFYIDNQDMFRRIFREKLVFIQRYVPRGTMLDVGAGVGLFLDEARSMGYNVIGFEPSRASTQAAKKYFGIKLIPQEFSLKPTKKYNHQCVDKIVLEHQFVNEAKDVKITKRDIFRPSSKRYGVNFGRNDVSSTRIDIVVINHVLEHLPNPREVISLCAKTLGDAGTLVIGVPNFDSFMSWIKRGKWQSLIPREHRWQFTLKTLDQLVLPHGFRRIAVSYENHDRSMHYRWKRPIYAVLDQIALWTGYAEAMLVIYQKI